MKYCTKCKGEFKARDYRRDSSRKNGFHPWCRDCSNKAMNAWGKRNKEKKENWNSQWRNKNPEKVKEYSRKTDLKRHFGISVEEYEKLLKIQNGQCLICLKKPNEKRLAVDHDHKTGRIRGLLCDRCNTVLGRIEDSTILLQNMINYLYANNEEDILNVYQLRVSQPF